MKNITITWNGLNILPCFEFTNRNFSVDYNEQGEVQAYLFIDGKQVPIEIGTKICYDIKQDKVSIVC